MAFTVYKNVVSHECLTTEAWTLALKVLAIKSKGDWGRKAVVLVVVNPT